MVRIRAVCPILVLALAGSASAAGWSQPQAVSHITSFISSPTLAFDPSGRALAAWDEQAGLGNFAHYRLEFAARDRAGNFGRPHELGADLSLGGVAVDRNGRSLVLALHSKAGQKDRLEVFGGTATGAFGKPQLVHTSPYTFMRPPRLAADATGDAAAIWRELPRRTGDSQVAMLATRTAGRAFGRARRVSSAGVSDVEVAMAGDGEFVVAWVRRGLVEARLGRGSKLGPVTRLAPNGGIRARSVAVAMDGAGDALVAWTSFTRSSLASRVSLSYQPARRGFTPAKEIAGWPQQVGAQGGLAAAFYATGKALVAWDGGDANGSGVFAATASGGSPSPPSRLSVPVVQPGPGEYDQLQTVAGGRATAAVAWTHFDAEGASFDSQGHLLVSDMDAAGHFALQPVTGAAIDALDATLAYSPRDRSTVALWRTKTTNRAFVSPHEFVGTASRR